MCYLLQSLNETQSILIRDKHLVLSHTFYPYSRKLQCFVISVFIFIIAFGLGMAFVPAISASPYYFDKKLTIASGIAASGIAVGNFLLPPLIRWLVKTYDWRQSLVIIGAISLNICVFGAVIRPVPQKIVQNKETLPILVAYAE